MNYLKKITLITVLFVIGGFCNYSYGETLYGFSGHFYRINEQYPKENYSRELDGGGVNIILNHFQNDNPLGWYIRTSFGVLDRGFEWQEDKMEPVNVYTSSDIRLSAGPSYNIKLGQIIQLPVSLGPVFTNYREDNSENLYDYEDTVFYNNNGYYRSISNANFLRAINLGLLADAAVVINPFRRYTIINGINIAWDFLRWESGKVQGDFRNIKKDKFKYTNYGAFTMGFYIGIGLRFENINSKNSEK